MPHTLSELLVVAAMHSDMVFDCFGAAGAAAAASMRGEELLLLASAEIDVSS